MDTRPIRHWIATTRAVLCIGATHQTACQILCAATVRLSKMRTFFRYAILPLIKLFRFYPNAR